MRLKTDIYSSIEKRVRAKSLHQLGNSKLMMLWATDNVLKAHDKLQILKLDNAGQKKIRDQIEKVILAMRKDIGHRNIGILSGDLLRFHKEN